MRNITIVVTEEVARWVRVHAAERETSVSRLVGDMLEERMRQDAGYEAAMSRFLAAAPRRLRKRGSRLPDRESLHDRAGLR